MSVTEPDSFRRPHLLGASDLHPSEIKTLFRVAQAFSSRVQMGENIPILAGKTVVNFFLEPSTRTRTSFELAARRLSAGILTFAPSGSSISKGETLIDTAKNIEAMRAHCLVVRHSSAGSAKYLSQHLKMPVINAGDGFHEHPTQGLLDAFTIEEKLGSVAGKRIVIIGDIAHSRVARSNIHILKKLGASVAVCGPPTLMPPHPSALGVDYAFRPEDLLPDADVVMALRIQFERQNKMQIPSVNEYSAFWGLNRKRAALLKKTAIILHPGPINRGVELDTEIADDSRSVILDQVFNGILVRMAVLCALVEPQGLQNWMNQHAPKGKK